MIEIVRSENFGQKLHSLGKSSQTHFFLVFNAVWQSVVDIDATNVEDFAHAEGTILGSSKKFIAKYSREEKTLLVDIVNV